MSKKQKTIMLEPNNQYENLQAESSFETDNIADLTESLSTEQTNELTNIICCQLPFFIIDNPYLITMFNTFNARYQIPCQQTIQNKILNKYNNMQQIILQELENPKKISIICDIWSSITMQLYLSITVHFINSEWQLRYFLLDLLPLTEQHTAIKIQQAIIE
ncbi:16310_t:CDS:2, partial [Cetraspora pellucida]